MARAIILRLSALNGSAYRLALICSAEISHVQVKIQKCLW